MNRLDIPTTRGSIENVQTQRLTRENSTRIKSSKTDAPATSNEELSFFEKKLEDFGFSESNCHCCGKHNSEIAGLLMQCGKCKKAYYCSMKCFNEHLPAHQKVCQTSALHSEPEKKTWTPLQTTKKVPPPPKNPPKLSIDRIGENLYKVNATDDESDEPVKVKGKDAEGNSFKSLHPGSLFRYTSAGTGRPSREDKRILPALGTVLELFGHGDLKVIAKNEHGKKATAKVSPAEPKPPQLDVELIDPKRRIHRIVVSDESGEPVTVTAVDSEGNVFDSSIDAPGACFRYLQSYDADTTNERCAAVGEDGEELYELSGLGDLIITATNAAGKKTTKKVHPVELGPPRLLVESVGGDLHRLVVSSDSEYYVGDDDDETCPSVTITAVDSQGHAAELKPGQIFSYTDAGVAPAMQKECNVAIHGTVQKLTGHGDLTITATNPAGKEAHATVKPSQAPLPVIRFKNLGRGLRQVVASDPSGDAITIEAVDSKGRLVTNTLAPESVFSYTEAGSGPVKKEDDDDSSHGSFEKLRGCGNLTVTVTNKAGMQAKAVVHPSEAEPPALGIIRVERGLYKVKADDESGEPVTITACDEDGNPFRSCLESGSLFRYTEAGERSNHEDTEDSEHGKVHHLHGQGDLTLTATNQAGKQAQASVQPAKVPPPKLELQEVEKDLYRIVASDDNGDVTVKAKDSDGNEFGQQLGPGSLFRYVEGDRPQEEIGESAHGRVHNLRGPAPELWIYCYNDAGKKAEARVKASPPELWIYCYHQGEGEPKDGVESSNGEAEKQRKKRDHSLDWNDEDYNFELDDLRHEPMEERVLTAEVADKLIFWWGRLGHPNKAKMKRLVATKLPECCGITVEDVELLPWNRSGLFVKTAELHQIISELNPDESDDDSE